MSYGREPQYIYECACGGAEDEGHGHTGGERHVVFLCRAILWDELAQFIAFADRGGELEELLARGQQLRPDIPWARRA